MSQHNDDTSRPPASLPAGFVGREEAARISGIGITAWKRWEDEGKLPFGQWLTLPWGGRCRIYPVDAIERMIREADLSFPPKGTVDRHGAARIFGVAERTFSAWENEGRINCGRLLSVPGKAGKYKVYPLDELHRLADAFKRQEKEAVERQQPYADPQRPGVVRVPVTSKKHQGMEAIIDADDLHLVQGKRWNWSVGVNRPTESGSVIWSGPATPLARIIMGLTDPALLVSHLNGDRLDYRRENLIVRTRSEVKRASKPPVKWQGFDPYADPDRPGVVRVPVLTEKHKGMEVIIDAADLPLVEGKRWHWSPGQNNRGSVVLSVSGTPKPTLARILLGIDDPERLVSHLNGDRLDCRRENLVVRTRSEVKRASKKAMVKGGKLCSSQFKGVTRTESGRKWAATIHIGGKYRNLGRFRSEIDAALAYDAALRELMGESVAGLNLPDPAEVERLRAMEPVVDENPTWPPPGLVDRHEACRMFGVSLTTWIVWERRGRITCGQYHLLPNDKPGRCKLYPKDMLELARVEIENLGKPYPDPDLPGIWRVPLKSYLTHREVLIDEADLPIVQGRNWNWSDRTDGRVEGNVVLASTTEQTPLHRLIMGVHGTTDERLRFLNGDPLDCRRANLAVLTLAEQVRGNRKMGSVSGRTYTSSYKGVSWSEPRGKWVAQISKDEVHKNIGRFDSEMDAAMAYDAAARVLFGEHGYLNFPDQPSSEQAMAAARHALDNASNRNRAQRQRQRNVELGLRRAAAEAKREEGVASDDGTMISHDTARQLFDVAPSVWKRWQQFGWTPQAVTVGEGEVMYRLADIAQLLLRCGLNVLPYPDPHRPGVYRVPLSGETARGREALIDADALPLVQTRRWRFAASDTGRGGEVETMNPSENIRLHYVVMGITSNKEHHVGHRNDDPLDCRRANLVVRTPTDTHANHRKQATFCGRPCTSRFKGVHREKRRDRWVATIKKDRVQRWLGSFRDEIAAAQAYDEAAREWFGEHARLNFPAGVDIRLEREAAAAAARAEAA